MSQDKNKITSCLSPKYPDNGFGKIVVAHIATAASIGVISAVLIHYRRRKTSPKSENHLAPLMERTESGRVGKIESFSHYLARQIGFKDENECPQLVKLGYEYLKRVKGVDDKIYEYLANNEGDDDVEDLYAKLVEEFERCILGYFAFHWRNTPQMISQVLSVNSEQKKLKQLVMAATRKQRFDKITKDLKVTRVFSTLVEEMKVIGTLAEMDELNHSDVMVPVALSERSPVLLLMGGGMGAGKSTVLKDIMKESFWSGAAANAVVVEADAFKETDVIYRALSSRGHHHDMLQTAELVHQSSTDAASSLLVTALNEGRDVIMDGTLSWVPFVEQTIAMARNVHKHRYRMGDGYKVAEDGTITEIYWVAEDEREEAKIKKAYRIELVGVICDAYLAVVRGIRRAIHMGRAVRVNSQLKSHKRFATAFPKYCPLVDNARLYCTNAPGGPPTLIAWKDGDSKLLVDQDEIKCLISVSSLNDEAESIYDLYKDADRISEAGSVWNDMVMFPTRSSLQLELKSTVQKIDIPVK